jgi:ankyrin repeat protein
MLKTLESRLAVGLLFVWVILGSVMARTIQVQRRQEKHNQALLKAIASDDAHAVRVLLALGADPNTREPGRYIHDPVDVWAQITDLHPEQRALTPTALMEAAGRGNVAIVEMLLDAGAAANAQMYDGLTALMVAAGTNKATARPTILLLVKHGANINAKTKSGISAWKYALKRSVAMSTLQEVADKR